MLKLSRFSQNAAMRRAISIIHQIDKTKDLKSKGLQRNLIKISP
jgi:hemerythrin superfamily protein